MVREFNNVTFDSVSFVPAPKCKRCAVTMKPASSTTWKCPLCTAEVCTGVMPLRDTKTGEYLANIATEIDSRQGDAMSEERGFVERRCYECGDGTIKPMVKAGRTMRYKTVQEMEIPTDLEIPTCDKCGSEWIDDDTAKRLDAACEAKYQEMQS